MPDATELCSTTNLKVMLGITSGSGSDAMLALIKAQIEAWVKTYCGREFLVASYTEYHDGYGDNQVRTLQRPIVSVTSVYSDPSRLFEAASLIPAADIIGDSRSYVLGYIELLTYRFLKGLKSTKIVYSAGYSTIPSDLSGAVMKIICHQFKISSKQLYAEVTHHVGDMDITLNTDTWPKDAMEIVHGYRRMDF